MHFILRYVFMQLYNRILKYIASPCFFDVVFCQAVWTVSSVFGGMIGGQWARLLRTGGPLARSSQTHITMWPCLADMTSCCTCGHLDRVPIRDSRHLLRLLQINIKLLRNSGQFICYCADACERFFSNFLNPLLLWSFFINLFLICQLIPLPL